VSEADLQRVQPGQAAVVTLDAFPGLELKGRVARVGTLARTDPERPFEEKRFDVTVDLDPSTADLRPEMTARVEILAGEKRDVLLVPVNAVFDHEGLPVCHVVRRFRTETRQVALGDSNGLYVEVRGGLEDGERVALTDIGTGDVVRAPEAPRGKSLMDELRRGGDPGSPLAPR
jgi:multidrug efflux pump subunit AcrA (membrane-fusion protein)